MGVVHSGHFWQLSLIISLATATTGGEILVTFWPKHGLRVPKLIRYSIMAKCCLLCHH